MPPKTKPAVKKAVKPVVKKELTKWQKFVKDHMQTPAIKKLPFTQRMKAISDIWKGPNKK